MVYEQPEPATSEHEHVRQTALGPADARRPKVGQIDDVAFIRTRRIGLSPLNSHTSEIVTLAKEPSVPHAFVQPDRVMNQYPLCGLLFCRCGAPFCRWSSPDSTREYMAVCGCRLRPIDAVTIERRVCTNAAKLDTSVVAGGWVEALGEVLACLYSRIEVGGTVDDVRFVPHTWAAPTVAAGQSAAVGGAGGLPPGPLTFREPRRSPAESTPLNSQ